MVKNVATKHSPETVSSIQNTIKQNNTKTPPAY